MPDIDFSPLCRPSEALQAIVRAAVHGPQPQASSAPAPVAAAPAITGASLLAPGPAPASPLARTGLGPITPVRLPALAPPAAATAKATGGVSTTELWGAAVSRRNAAMRAAAPWAFGGGEPAALDATTPPVSASEPPAGQSAGAALMLAASHRTNALRRAGKL